MGSTQSRCAVPQTPFVIATDGAWCQQHGRDLHGKQIRRFAVSAAADTGICLHYSLFYYAFILRIAAFMGIS
jgi:hypothetical protein